MLFAASCGSGDREADLIEVSDGFHAALERRDGAGACSRVSADTVATLEQQEKRPCSEAILELDLPAGARASGAGVYVTSGYAALPGSRVAFLDQGPDGLARVCRGLRPERARSSVRLRARRLTMRVMFVLYLTVIFLGLVLAITVGLLHA